MNAPLPFYFRLLIILLCTLYTGLAHASIIRGPIVNPANGHLYYLLSQKTWSSSELEATTLGGHLVTINDAAEQLWVFQTFSQQPGGQRLLWIGLNDVETEGTYVWSSGEKPTNAFWTPGEPNNANNNEHFVAMYYSGHSSQALWNDWPHINADPIGLPFQGVVEVVPNRATLTVPGGAVGWWTGDYLQRGFKNRAVPNDNVTFPAATFGTGYFFNGTNSVVAVPDTGSEAPPQLTISCWVTFSSQDTPGASVAGLQYLVFKRRPTNSGFEGYTLVKDRLSGKDRFKFVLARGTGAANQVVVQSQSTIVVGRTYHLAATHDGVTARLYVDGRLDAALNAPFPIATGTEPLYFGSSEGSYNGRFHGLLDEIILFNRALSRAEVVSLASHVNAPFKLELKKRGDGLQFLWTPTAIHPGNWLKISTEVQAGYEQFIPTGIYRDRFQGALDLPLPGGPIFLRGRID